ncbi:MAG TPA: metallophosphoesterase, partial [Chloroflexota bacterium]|nr:metallophosphoesterase [Chloroflexota bacterium]
MGVLVPQIGVAHAASTTFSFGAAGDFGAANAVTATLDNMASSNLNFGLALGDLSYNQIQPASAWCTYVHQNIGSLPFELTSGNHEDGGDVAQGLIWDFASCLPNQMSNMAGKYGEQYTFDYPVANPIARFIMISPGLLFSNGDTYNYNQGGADYNWVSNQIDSARAAGIQWIIVGMHKVCLTSGGSACDVGTPLMNLLISKHVDLILQGHDHNYQRSKQIAFNGGSCTSVTPAAYNAACVVNNGASGTYQEGSGTVIVIQGTGGVDDEYGAIYQNPDSPYFEVRSGSNLNPQKGFVKYTVSTSGITAQFVPSTTTSTFTDSFAISATAGPTPTPVPSGETIMSDNFDSQSPGPPLTGTGSNEFTSVAGTNNLTVQNGVADSAPNALALTMQSGGGSYMYEQYGAGYVTHTLQFNVRLGSNFNLPSADYMVLAQTLAMDATSSAGKVSLVVPGGGGGMYVDYFDSGGNQHFLWSGTALSAGSWHTIDLQDTVGSGTTGALALFLDGRAIASQSSIDTGNLPLGAFSLGNEHSSTDAAIGGSLYLDDVATMNGIGFPGGSGSTPTPTPTSSPTATPSVTPSPTPTAPPGVISSIDFDGQGTGALQTGPAYTQFSGQSGAANLAVESTIADSAPNALAVTMKSGGGVYGLEQYAGSGYATHTLQFNVQLGSDFVLPPADYMTLAQTLAAGGGGSNAGKLSLIVSGGTHTLHIDYFDSTGAQHYLYSSAALALGSWHNISLQETAGVGTGALVLSMDGKSVASATGIDIGSQGVGYFALGDEYSP